MISLSIFLLPLALIFVSKGVVIVQQAEVVIIERLGKFDRVLQSGFNFIIPIFYVSQYFIFFIIETYGINIFLISSSLVFNIYVI